MVEVASSAGCFSLFIVVGVVVVMGACESVTDCSLVLELTDMGDMERTGRGPTAAPANGTGFFTRASLSNLLSSADFLGGLPSSTAAARIES